MGDIFIQTTTAPSMWALCPQCLESSAGWTLLDRLLSEACSHFLFFWRKIHQNIKQFESRKMKGINKFGTW